MGVFGVPVALVFVDDDTGRAMAYAPPVVVIRTAFQDRAATVRTLRDGLAMVDAIASDQWDDAAVTVRRLQEVAVETLRRAGMIGLDGSRRDSAHSTTPRQVAHSWARRATAKTVAGLGVLPRGLFHSLPSFPRAPVKVGRNFLALLTNLWVV
jgi:hypothetical protein